jgi:hypothetical protein
MIEKEQLQETDLIVRDKWPEYDEDAYLREAEKFRTSSMHAENASIAARNSASYTNEEFHGRSGTAMEDTMTQRGGELTSSGERHLSVGQAMTAAARNIMATKTEINEAQIRYHEKFEKACKTSGEEGWPQAHLNDVKKQLVQEAQSRVDAARSEMDATHSRIVSGISTAVDG